LQLGQLAPSGTELYAAVPLQPETVFTISHIFEKKLLPDFMGLRSRQIFSLADVQAVTVTYSDLPISLALKDGAWQAVPPSSEKSAQVTRLVKTLRALVYMNYFPAVAEGNIAEYGLSLPDANIALTDTHGVVQRYDISMYGGRYYLRANAPGPQDALILSDQSASDFLKVLPEFVVHRGAR
jgi:hypothetical protein